MPLPASLANSLELPVVGSPLFIVSGPELVIAQCKAGVVGSFPALNARPVEKLDEWLTRIENELGEYKALHPEKKVAPYAVNQICHVSNDRLMQDMEACVKHKAPIIITDAVASGGGRPVSGSFGCELISRRSSGSERIAIIVPSSLRPPLARTSPSTPPITDSSRLSAITGRATSHRLAPSAPLTAISRRRLDNRASSRFAMLAQTIISRNPTAPISTINAGRLAPTN